MCLLNLIPYSAVHKIKFFFGKITEGSRVIDENSLETWLIMGPCGPIWEIVIWPRKWPLVAISGRTHCSCGTLSLHHLYLSII